MCLPTFSWHQLFWHSETVLHSVPCALHQTWPSALGRLFSSVQSHPWLSPVDLGPGDCVHPAEPLVCWHWQKGHVWPWACLCWAHCYGGYGAQGPGLRVLGSQSMLSRPRMSWKQIKGGQTLSSPAGLRQWSCISAAEGELGLGLT